jgi:hypothetical protein
MKLSKSFAVFAVTLLAANANAGVVSVGCTTSDANVACAGCVALDITINFDGNLRGQQLWINLTSGSIYNTPAVGGETAPAQAFVGIIPELAFDSFVTIGGLTSGSSEDVIVVGGAVDIPGAPSTKTFAGNTVSIAWAPGTGVNVPRGTNYPVARITLSPDANGDLWFFSSTSGGDPPVLTRRSLIGGIVCIPEPDSMALAGFIALGLFAIRRRS